MSIHQAFIMNITFYGKVLTHPNSYITVDLKPVQAMLQMCSLSIKEILIDNISTLPLITQKCANKNIKI